MFIHLESESSHMNLQCKLFVLKCTSDSPHQQKDLKQLPTVVPCGDNVTLTKIDIEHISHITSREVDFHSVPNKLKPFAVW